jgi:hypothetical protein
MEVSSLSEFMQYLESKIEDRMIFRGQAYANWKLIPSVQRKEVVPAKNDDDRLRCEREMLDQFEKRARPYFSDRPEISNEWDWLALAQHYGLPTRFLDWTENAAAALFFAVEMPNNGEPSAVWCTKRPNKAKHKSPFDIDGVYLCEPPHLLPRITVQQACFTAHPTDYLTKIYKWPGDHFRIITPAVARDAIRVALRSVGIHSPDRVSGEIAPRGDA